MTEETQIDPPWRAKLRSDVLAAAIKVNTAYERGAVQPWTPMTDAVLAAVLPHMETAYRTGRMAGASASAARLAQKNLELAKKLREVREWSDQLDDVDRPGLLTILSEDS
jgi:hypothetical protein